MKDFLLTALAYAGWLFVACAAVVALTWFALGLWNLAKIYFDAWKAKEIEQSGDPRDAGYKPGKIL